MQCYPPCEERHRAITSASSRSIARWYAVAMKSRPKAMAIPMRICLHDGRPTGIGVISHAQKPANASPLVIRISRTTAFVIRFLAFIAFDFKS